MAADAMAPRKGDCPSGISYAGGVSGPHLGVDKAALAALCKRYGIARLEIFGSVSRGDAGPASDLDVLYELRSGARLGWDIELLADELSLLFGRRVDLLSKVSLHPDLRDTVLAEAQPLYAA
jgi:predicted nucleotidyltransferase